MDLTRFYVVLDTNFLIDFLRTEVAYLKHSWKALGRPIVTITITHQLLGRFLARFVSISFLFLLMVMVPTDLFFFFFGSVKTEMPI